MIEFLFLLVEILAIVYLIHNIVGVSVKVDVYLIMLLAIGLGITIAIINDLIWDKGVCIVYGLLGLYVVVELKKRMVDAICICGVALCLVTVLQTVLFLPMGLLYYLVPYEDFLVLITNGGVFIILKLLKKTNIYSKTKEFLENSGIKIIISMFVLIYIYFYFAHIFKITGKIPIEIYAMMLAFMLVTAYIIYSLQKSNYMLKLKEDEINISRMCSESFEQLINHARKNQHDFHNHLLAIKGMQHSIKDFDELVKKQEKYIQKIKENNRYDSILYTIQEPILAGYVFNKVSEIENEKIRVHYNFAVTTKRIEYISIFHLNEIIGILLDNAKEAVEQMEETRRNINFHIMETVDKLTIKVTNISEKIEQNKIIELFKEGYSSKENHGGLGLRKIKELVDKYSYDIMPYNQMINNENHIVFEIVIYK